MKFNLRTTTSNKANKQYKETKLVQIPVSELLQESFLIIKSIKKDGNQKILYKLKLKYVIEDGLLFPIPVGHTKLSIPTEEVDFYNTEKLTSYITLGSKYTINFDVFANIILKDEIVVIHFGK